MNTFDTHHTFFWAGNFSVFLPITRSIFLIHIKLLRFMTIINSTMEMGIYFLHNISVPPATISVKCSINNIFTQQYSTISRYLTFLRDKQELHCCDVIRNGTFSTVVMTNTIQNKNKLQNKTIDFLSGIENLAGRKCFLSAGR